MEIQNITVEDLRRMEDKEGLILQGCGGEPGEWVKGINDLLTQDGILLEGTAFTHVSVFQNEGLTCLLFPFEDVKLDIGKLAMWRNGEEFSSFVKLDMNTGRTMYSRTPNGFNEQQAPRIPAEVYGHVFTAQEKANLQDGKTLLVEGLKNNGQTFSSYLKVNPYSGQLQYFQENPDIRRDTSRRAAQTETAQGQQQEQKKGASQAV